MFFLATFSLSSLQKEWIYDMQKPFTTKNTTDISTDWSLWGSVVPTKTLVRMTSALTDSYGALCHQKPTVFNDWEANFEIRARDGNGGDGFYFYYSKEFCVPSKYDLFVTTRTGLRDDEGEDYKKESTSQVFPTYWDGFVLWINTTSTVDRASVYLAQSTKKEAINFRNLSSLGTFPVRGDVPVKIKVTKRENKVQARFEKGSTAYTFDQTFTDLPEQGYFGIAASTTGRADNNDLLSFTVTPLSDVKEELVKNVSENTTKINRNTLLLSKESRRIKKRSRAAAMKTSVKYNIDRKKKGHLIDGKEYTFNDLSAMIKEATLRARETITNDMLSDFLIPEIEKSLAVATMKINLQMERMKETRSYLDDVWAGLRNTLLDLSIETRQNMTDLGREAISFASAITLKGADEVGLEDKKGINDVVEEQRLEGSSFIPFMFICFCIVEFVVYVIWFNNKRIRTMNFKKAD